MKKIIAVTLLLLLPSYAAAITPNDEYFSKQYNLERINAPDAWSRTTGGQDIYVAVLDSGISEHEDLAANIDSELSANFRANLAWNDDRVGHGTHVAGIIGAVGNNTTGVAGVNWRVKIIALNVANASNDTDDNAVISALNYLVKLLQDNPDMKLAAVNMSFGSYMSRDPEEMKNTPYYLAFKALDDTNRTLMIMAAGNEGIEAGRPAPFDQPEMLMEQKNLTKPLFYEGDYAYPASFELRNRLIVGAIDRDNSAPDFTNWGESVDIAAPGTDIFSTYKNDAYVEQNGTSMAAPHVTGAAALLAAAFPNASAQDIRNALISGANKRINPIVTPYAKMIEDLDIEDENEALFIYDLEPYSLLDGMGQVANQNSGLMDVNAAMQILDGNRSKYANTNTNYDSGGSCNTGAGLAAGAAMIALFCMIAFIPKKN